MEFDDHGNDASGTAILSSQGNMTVFEFADQSIRFRAPDNLRRYTKVITWDNGYIEVMADYERTGEIEEYIDLIPVLENLHINPETFLAPIKKLEIRYADE